MKDFMDIDFAKTFDRSKGQIVTIIHENPKLYFHKIADGYIVELWSKVGILEMYINEHMLDDLIMSLELLRAKK